MSGLATVALPGVAVRTTWIAATCAGAAIAVALTAALSPTALDRFSTLQHVQASHGSASQAGRPVTEVRPIACNALTNVLGKSVITAIVHFPPDAFTAAHRHPGSVVAVVISGTLRSQLDGGSIGTYTTHQAWFEPSGALHNFVENASTTEPADLLATFIVDGNCGPLVIPEPRP